MLSASLSEIFVPDFFVDANLRLGMTLSMDEFPILPTLRADFVFDWGWRIGEEFSMPDVSLENVRLDVGTLITDFLSPISKKIQDIIEPLRPLVEVLTESLPRSRSHARPTQPDGIG